MVLAALLDMGFDDVYEVAKAAELVSDATRRILQTGSIERPVISSACPAVTRLIRVRFPQLIDHVLPLVAPIELAARLAKKEAVRRTGLPKEDIGCIFITPCPAKVTAIHSPIGSSRSEVDGAVAIKEVYPRLLGVHEAYLADGLSGQRRTHRPGLGRERRRGRGPDLHRQLSCGGRHRERHPRAGGPGGRKDTGTWTL